MPEQPDPEPRKAKPQTAPKASSSSQGADLSSASAYVPRPGAPQGKNRTVLALAALIAAGALGGAALYFKAPPAPPPGIVFAKAFMKSSSPGAALGWNVLGAVFGGLAEYACLVVGLRALVLFALAFYAAARLSRTGLRRLFPLPS